LTLPSTWVLFVDKVRHISINSSQVDVTLFRKADPASNSWRQVIRIPQFKLCGGLKTGANFAIFKNFIRLVRTLFPNAPNGCPSVLPLHYDNGGINYTDGFQQTLIDEFKNTFRITISKGMAKAVVMLTAEDDSKVLKVEIVAEVK
jgi:hypothetical protein